VRGRERRPDSVGTNGIGFYRGDFYVINTDKWLVLRIAVRPDGNPGQPKVRKQVADLLECFPILDYLALR
jgi:hypothetical protein